MTKSDLSIYTLIDVGTYGLTSDEINSLSVLDVWGVVDSVFASGNLSIYAARDYIEALEIHQVVKDMLLACITSAVTAICRILHSVEPPTYYKVSGIVTVPDTNFLYLKITKDKQHDRICNFKFSMG